MSKRVALMLVLVFLTASCLIVIKTVWLPSADSENPKTPLPTARSILGVAVVDEDSAAQLSATADKVLVFLRDVVMLDVEKYDVVEAIGPLVEDKQSGWLPLTSGKLSLYSETSILDVLYNFVGDSLTGCSFYAIRGSAEYLQPLPADLADAASLFLQNYQAYSGDSSIAAMKDMLDDVDVTNDTTKIVGNLKLEITNDMLTSFQWRRTFNGADYHGIGINYKDGAFSSFGQDMSYYKIGNTDVKITREQAIDIALERAESFSYLHLGRRIETFTILEDHIIAELRVKSRYEAYLLYPLWMVDLPLDDIYPGSVFFIRVNLWADNGEIINIRPLGGGLPSDGSSTASSTAEPTGTKLSEAELTTAMYIIAVVATVPVLITIPIIILKKRSNRN